MTNQEAIERIKDHIDIHKINEKNAVYISEALDMAISALEKQIPKKPKKVDHWRLCPNCFDKHGFSYDYLVGMKQRGNEDISYCLGCGQAIDGEGKE